jgi:hypothetical protein
MGENGNHHWGQHTEYPGHKRPLHSTPGMPKELSERGETPMPYSPSKVAQACPHLATSVAGLDAHAYRHIAGLLRGLLKPPCCIVIALFASMGASACSVDFDAEEKSETEPAKDADGGQAYSGDAGAPDDPESIDAGAPGPESMGAMDAGAPGDDGLCKLDRSTLPCVLAK